MRCPTCGAPVMVRKDSWECGYCCDCGNLPRPRIVLTVDVEEEPKLTIESLAENADPDTALLLRKFSKTLGAWDIEELSAMGAVEILERAYGEDHREGIAMWSALLCAAHSREAAKQKNTEEIPDTVPGSGSGLREDYDDLENLHEDGDYKDLNEERNE